MTAEDQAAVAQVLNSGWLSSGPEVHAFERAVANRIGVSHAVAVSSGTSALVLALEALGIGPGDEVIVCGFTYVATLHAIRLVGATPKVVDVSATTFNLDPAQLPAAMTERTRAILPVDQFGLPADMDGIRAVTQLPIVEDAACALGARRGTELCGKNVTLACFSFHPRKIITTGEGGMVVTDDDVLAAALRRKRSHGRNQDGHFVEVAGNQRLSDFAAALGRSQLTRLDELVTRRRELAHAYRVRLASHQHLALQQEPPGFRHCYQTFAVRLLGANAERRAGVVAALRAQNIECTIATNSATLELPYRDEPQCQPKQLPVSHALGTAGVALPLHPGLTERDIDHVCKTLVASL